MSICLSNSNFFQDGLGAQIQRRFEVYLMAKEFGLNFNYLPIENFDSNYGDGLPTIESRENEIALLEDIHNLKSFSCSHTKHIDVLSQDFIHKILTGSYRSKFALNLLKFFSALLNLHFRFYIDEPHKIRWDISGALKKYMLSKKTEKVGRKNVKIVLHLPWARASLQKDRAIPIYWYTKILDFVLKNLDLKNMKYELNIHTDAGSNLDSTKEVNWLSSATTDYFVGNNNSEFLEGKGFANIDVEKVFSNYKIKHIFRNIPPSQVWQDFADADVLILSNSSLSHVGALLNSSFTIGFIPKRNAYPLLDIHPISLSSDEMIQELKSEFFKIKWDLNN